MKSITEKAQQLGCDKETVRKLCIACKLPCKKVGSTYIVFETDEIVAVSERLGGGYDVLSTEDKRIQKTALEVIKGEEEEDKNN